MAGSSKISIISVIVCMTIGLFICSPASYAQKTEDTAKLYAEIAGDYEFAAEGETVILTFFVKDGVLMGKSNEDDEEVPLEPVEGKELSFEATNSNGQFYELTFSRDESGKIAKCLVMTLGMELEGVKIKR